MSQVERVEVLVVGSGAGGKLLAMDMASRPARPILPCIRQQILEHLRGPLASVRRRHAARPRPPATVQRTLPASLPVKRAASMEEAVSTAAGLAHPGDAVVLSPACSSFDMFRDYAHRADVFRAAVRAQIAGEASS